MELLEKIQKEAKELRISGSIGRFVGAVCVAATTVAGLITVDKIADAHTEHSALSFEERQDFERNNDPTFPAAFTVLFASSAAYALSKANSESARAAALEAQAFSLEKQSA